MVLILEIQFCFNAKHHTVILSAIPHMVYNILPVFLVPDWTVECEAPLQ